MMETRIYSILISYIGALMFVCGLVKTIFKYIFLWLNQDSDKTIYPTMLSIILGAYLVYRFYKPLSDK